MSESTPAEPRKTTVTVGVSRLLNTAQYENIQVTLNLTDEITWSTPAEREQKIANLTTRLTAQYANTQKQVLNDIGVEEKRAWIKAPAPAPKVTKKLVGDPLDD